jgi:uncharacterized protein (TIGR03067 family)
MAIVSCPECNKKLKVADTSVGKKVKCSCGNIFVAQVDAPVEAVPAAAEKVYVACTECGAKLKVPTTSLGKKMKCPKCAGIFVAQLEEEAPPPPPPEPEPELADDEDMPPPMAKPIKKPVMDDDDLAAFADDERRMGEEEEMPRPKAKGKGKKTDDFDDEPMPKGKPGKKPPLKSKADDGSKPVYPSRVLQTLLVTLMLLGLAGIFAIMFFGPEFDLDVAKIAGIKSAEGLKKLPKRDDKGQNKVLDQEKGKDKNTDKKTDDSKPGDKDGKSGDKDKSLDKDKNGEKDGNSKIDDKGAGIEGNWSVVSAVMNGKADNEKIGDLMTFEKGKATLGGAPASYSLDNSNNPRSIDFTMEVGPGKLMKYPAIYKIEGDKLYLGFPGDIKNPQRPKDFDGKDDMTVVLRRTAKGEKAYSRTGSINNLKQLGLSIHSYHDTNKGVPPISITDDAGKPLLSWRVAILPYLDEIELYNAFDLTKPWNDPHNMKLISRMPKALMIPGIQAKEGMTHYRALSGPDTPLEPVKGAGKSKGRSLLSMTDGTSNVIVIVEATDPTIWTRPDDLAFDPKGPLPKFGVVPAGFNACFCDGTVRFIDAKTPENVLRPYLTCNNGMPRQPLEKE